MFILKEMIQYSDANERIVIWNLCRCILLLKHCLMILYEVVVVFFCWWWL